MTDADVRDDVLCATFLNKTAMFAEPTFKTVEAAVRNDPEVKGRLGQALRRELVHVAFIHARVCFMRRAANVLALLSAIVRQAVKEQYKAVVDLHDDGDGEDKDADGQAKDADGEAQFRNRQCFHFVTFVVVDNELYELDGRKRFPIAHGPSTAATLLQDSAAVMRNVMERDAGLEFHMLAVTRGGA